MRSQPASGFPCQFQLHADPAGSRRDHRTEAPGDDVFHFGVRARLPEPVQDDALKDRRVSPVTSADLKDYQAKLKKAGAKPATIDQDRGKVNAMVYAVFESGKVGADVFRALRAVKKTLVKGSDVRSRVISSDEYAPGRRFRARNHGDNRPQ